MADEAPKAKMLIKAQRCIVLGVDDQCKYRRLCADGAGERIDDQRAAKALSTKLLIDRKPANQGSRDGRVARQTTGRFGRQLGKRDARRSKGVVSRNDAGWAERHEAVIHSASHILCRAFPQITVEGFDAAGKTGTTVRRAQSFGCKPSDQRETVMILR